MPYRNRKRVDIVKYKLSKDKLGLLAYFVTVPRKKGNALLSYYHIHSDELTKLEKWIRKLLLTEGVIVKGEKIKKGQ